MKTSDISIRIYFTFFFPLFKPSFSQFSTAIQYYLRCITRKAQLTQKGTCNSSACLKARCEQNLSSPIPATMFHLHSPEGATSLTQLHWLKIANFSYPTSLSALARNDRF